MAESDKRDVLLHTAVTFTNFRTSPGAKPLEFPNEKEKDVCEFQAHFPFWKTPTPEKYVRKAFDEMKEAAVKKMRDAGLVTL